MVSVRWLKASCPAKRSMFFTFLQAVLELQQLLLVFVIDIAGHAAWRNPAAQETVPGEPFIPALTIFFKTATDADACVEADAGAKIPHIPQMVVQPLQLAGDKAQHSGARGDFLAAKRFDRLAKGHGMGNAASAADAFYAMKSLADGAFHGFFYAAVRVERRASVMQHCHRLG